MIDRLIYGIVLAGSLYLGGSAILHVGQLNFLHTPPRQPLAGEYISVPLAAWRNAAGDQPLAACLAQHPELAASLGTVQALYDARDPAGPSSSWLGTLLGGEAVIIWQDCRVTRSRG